MASDTLAVYFPELLRHEGGYVDHPRDPGGATNMGVTIATLRAWLKRPVTKQEVRMLTRGEAQRIYRAMYWDTIQADSLPRGVDAMLFDVAVNSGVGRARQWKPLIENRSPVDAIKAIGTRRRAFFQSLKTFSTFGKGWMRRVNEVEAWCLRFAVNALGGSPVQTLKREAGESKDKAKKAKTGAAAVGTSGAVSGGGAIQVEAAQSVPSWVWLIVIAIVAASVAFLWWRGLQEDDRAAVMLKEAEAASDD
jgi:lysozyme family protein